MRRVAGLMATGLGAFLLVFGLLMRYWVPVQVITFPLNEYSVTTLSGTGISYFSSSLLHEFRDVAATQTTTIEGDVASGSPSVAVWGSFTAIEDTTDHTAIQDLSQRAAFNRRTGLLVRCCAAAVGSDTRVDQAGLGFRFPLGTRHQTYLVFDPTLLAPVAFRFAGTAVIDGLPVDRFTEHVAGRRFGQQTLPGSLVGEPQQATVTLPESLTATSTFWVDPLTGVIVDETVDQTVQLQGTTAAERLVLLGGTLSQTAPSVAAAVASSQQQHARIRLIQVTIPLIGILLGLIALAAGLTLVLTAPEPWVPAYEDDDVPDLARLSRLSRCGGRVGRGLGQYVQQPRGGGRVGRIAVGHGEHVPPRARQLSDRDARVPGRAQAQPGQRGHPQPGRDQGLDGHVVVGGEGHLRGEAGQRALPDQVAAAPLAAGDPPVPGVVGQLRGAAPASRAGRAAVTRCTGSSSSSRPRVPSSAALGACGSVPAW